MTARRDDVAEVGPWAEEKLDILERYLDAYTKVFKNQPWFTTIYVDAFAGGGRAKVRQKPRADDQQYDLLGLETAPEQEKFIEGSPRRALRIANPFSSYIFIDADPSRVAALEAIKAEYGSERKIVVRPGMAEDQISWVLSRNPTKDRHRGVVFLDPFGAHIKWQTVEALAKTEVFEVIVNLPLHMAINRQVTKDPEIRQTWRDQLDDHLPQGWYDEAYDRDGGLFDSAPVKREDAIRRLLEFYRLHLKATFGHVSTPRLIRNTRKSPLYYLLWAGPHKKGLQIADDIMKMGERLPGRVARQRSP